MPGPASDPASDGSALTGQTSALLLAQARDGDRGALGRLLDRYLPTLRQWAHGRLPRPARRVADTDDLIQDVVLRTTGRLDQFELRGRQAFAAYLRQAVLNRIRDEHRRLSRRGAPESLPDLADPSPSPLDLAIKSEAESRYRSALDRLTPRDLELVVAHIELDYSHEQLGCMTGRSANAARMALHRAMQRLVAHMQHG